MIKFYDKENFTTVGYDANYTLVVSMDRVDLPASFLIQNPQNNIHFIRCVYTKKEFRNKGYMTRLFEAILTKGNVYQLCVDKTNERAKNFYEKLGFKIRHSCDFSHFMEWR